MSNDLAVNVLQCALAWESAEENYNSISGLLEGTPPCDVIVLPEMFTTGFSMEPERVAERHDSDGMRSLEWMAALAATRSAAVTGSVSVEASGRYFNRMYWVEPDGAVQWYDKRHLFSFANEHDHYTAGRDRLIVDWRGWKILLQVCYDLRFPEYIRNNVLDAGPAYDAAVFVANWPAVRSRQWKVLLLARAIENQCYVIGCNRVGEDGNNMMYSGDSSVIDPTGDYLAEAIPGNEMVVHASLSRGRLEDLRKAFPVLLDQ